jgi:hypothetical protein
VHRLGLKNENTTFPKLDLFPSSGEGRKMPNLLGLWNDVHELLKESPVRKKVMISKIYIYYKIKTVTNAGAFSLQTNYTD